MATPSKTGKDLAQFNVKNAVYALEGTPSTVKPMTWMNTFSKDRNVTTHAFYGDGEMIVSIRHTVSICWPKKGELPTSMRTGKKRKSSHGAKSPPIPDTRRSWTAFPCPRRHQRKLTRHLAIYPSCFPYRIAVRDYERKSAAGGGCNSRIVQKEIIT